MQPSCFNCNHRWTQMNTNKIFNRQSAKNAKLKMSSVIFFIILILSFTKARAAPVERIYREMISFHIEESFAVHNLTITRDAATFELESGTIDLIEPVEGHYHT